MIAERVDNSDRIYFIGTIDEVMLKIAPNVAVYFLRRNILPNQEIIREMPDGTLFVLCKNVHEREILPQVKYWLSYVEIVSPDKLQQKFFQDLKDYVVKHQASLSEKDGFL